MARAVIDSASMNLDLGNGMVDLGLDLTINFNAFDRETNLTYVGEVSLVGDDSTDNGFDGFNPQVSGFPLTFRVRSNGDESVERSITRQVTATELSEDFASNEFANTDEEFRIAVTMIPELPQVNTTESGVFTIPDQD